jgi:hypothetical protein
VYAVQADSTVQAVKISQLTSDDGFAAVAGLPPGTRVVIEGTHNLRPGTKVREAGTGASKAASAPANKPKP